MKVFHSPAEVPPDFGPSAVTVGNFDGVHIGHRRIMQRLVTAARAEALVPTVLTFDPHPARVLAPDRAPRLILTTAQKLKRFEEQGIEVALLLPFSLEFAKLTPEQFAEDVLSRTLKARRVLVGEDFRFGHRQSGNVETLCELGASLGFILDPVADIGTRGERFSSSAIRTLVSAGRVSRACRMMGAPFALEGAVVKGRGIGSTQTVPTLNLAPENELLPKAGVYVTRVRDLADGREWPAITNVGIRPTFGDQGGVTVESFLLGPFDGGTPSRIEVAFLAFVRDERKFESADQLKGQILRDAGAALRFHRRFARLRMG